MITNPVKVQNKDNINFYFSRGREYVFISNNTTVLIRGDIFLKKKKNEKQKTDGVFLFKTFHNLFATVYSIFILIYAPTLINAPSHLYNGKK